MSKKMKNKMGCITDPRSRRLDETRWEKRRMEVTFAQNVITDNYGVTLRTEGRLWAFVNTVITA
jgi:hypothetical protein